jgi:hypothetical protein
LAIEDIIAASAFRPINYVCIAGRVSKFPSSFLKRIFHSASVKAFIILNDITALTVFQSNYPLPKINSRVINLFVKTPIPKAKRIGIGKLNNPAKRRVLYP